MKKILTALTLGISLIGLSACSITGNNTVVETKAGNITKDDLYKQLVKANGASVLERMIETKVLEGNYSVASKDIDAAYNKAKANFKTEDEFKSALQTNGFADEQAFKDQIKLSLLQQKAMTDGIKVTDDQLQKYYDAHKEDFVTVRASHILVSDLATAQEIKKELDKGADFAALAKAKSIDTASAAKGGDLGTFKKSDMVAEFANAAFSMKVGTISDPVKSQYGYHIIKVTDRTQLTLEKNKDQIKQAYLLANAKPISEVIANLKKKDNVKIDDADLQNSINQMLANATSSTSAQQ